MYHLGGVSKAKSLLAGYLAYNPKLGTQLTTILPSTYTDSDACTRDNEIHVSLILFTFVIYDSGA